mmetsp:Transcript_18709/g.34874  ORF Transcript_18709/g.34874 Transcript_18709/m.34874 type:complete len:345 (-) Transcript_18709:331-1365(-)
MLSNISNATSATVHYVLLGNQNASDAVYNRCSKTGLACHQIQYQPTGSEDMTLQSLFDFCKDNTDSFVAYLHNKGSYHPSRQNHLLRKFLTKAVLSDECQSIGKTDSSCNICGARFSMLPHHHYPGNMWAAHCSYIKDLIPPKDFPQHMNRLVHSIDEKYPGTFKLRQLSQFGPNLGTGRFAFEHWVTSHPDMKPCDVYTGRYRFGYQGITRSQIWEPQLQHAGWIPYTGFSQRWQPSVGREWYCGMGRLLEFLELYGKLPPKESFVWAEFRNPFSECPNAIEYPTSTNGTHLLSIPLQSEMHKVHAMFGSLAIKEEESESKSGSESGSESKSGSESESEDDRL